MREILENKSDIEDTQIKLIYIDLSVCIHFQGCDYSACTAIVLVKTVSVLGYAFSAWLQIA